MEIGDKVRSVDYPKEIGVIVNSPRPGIFMVRLNRDSGGANHIIVSEKELELY